MDISSLSVENLTGLLKYFPKIGGIKIIFKIAVSGYFMTKKKSKKGPTAFKLWVGLDGSFLLYIS